MSPNSAGGEARQSLTLEAAAQKVLDELWLERTIPFQMRIGKITKDTDVHTIHFYDSRIRTVSLTVDEGQLFPDVFRSAVLKRVKTMSGPLPIRETLSADQ